MQDKSINILSTRPLGITVMEKAKNESIAIDIIFFIETKNTINKIVAPKIHQATTKETAIAFTSMNAAEAVIDFCKAINAEPEWTIYTLGGITHTILKEFFTGSGIFAGADNASQLAQLIIKNEEDEVVFFCGNQRRQELPEMLKEKNISVEEIEVYETIETPVLVEKKYDGILFFSPSAVKSFFSINAVDAATVLFAIGATTAEALKRNSKNKILMGSQPDKEQLAMQAIEFFMNN